MIVRDEEINLDKCLSSCKDLFDEIIIVDTGSIDNTKNVAEKYTNKIYDFKWTNNFSDARNYSFKQATKDYIMWLDADDVINNKNRKKLMKLKKNLSYDIDIVMMKYDIAFNENDESIFSYYRERLVKRSKKFLWNDRVHEYISMSGKIIKEDISVEHRKTIYNKSDRNLKIYLDMQKNKEKFTTRNLYYFGRELMDHEKYCEAIKILKKFLNRKDGWKEDSINACIIISECYLNINKIEDSIEYLYKTFYYDLPKAKTCCLIANQYFNKNEYEKAIFWYNQVFNLPIEDNLSFNESEYNNFIPNLGLCICYDKIGKKDIALEYHNKCYLLNSKHPAVICNEKYFKKNIA